MTRPGAAKHPGAAVSLVLSLGLLASVGAYRAKYQVPPPEADQYHRRIREQAALLPLRIGSWMGQDIPVTAGAVALLHPNLIISRQFTDVATNQVVNLLVVQCRDARDMLGHYPPVCYVGHGWTPVTSEARTWQVDGMKIEGMSYEFSRTRLQGVAHVVVYDFMLLPEGRTCRDMDSVDAAARGARSRFFGAAQVQIEFDASALADERDQVFAELLAASKPLLDQIRSGVNQ